MKALISVDMEGMPYIVNPNQLRLKGALYDEGRRIATRITSIAASELNKNGFEKVIIADSHGSMVNIIVDDLPEYVEIIRGYPRLLSMISGIEDCNALLLLGYHAKFGTSKSTFDHTYNGGIITKVEVNGVEASEFLLSAYTAGEMDVPVILVAGDAQLIKDDVITYAPWAQTLALKHSMGRLSARSSSMITIERELREAVKKAATKLKQNKAKLLKLEKPIRVAVTFQKTHFADAAELLPKAKRIGGLKVEYSANSMVEAYRTFELLVFASAGVTAILKS
jgi:D-amino peptidase